MDPTSSSSSSSSTTSAAAAAAVTDHDTQLYSSADQYGGGGGKLQLELQQRVFTYFDEDGDGKISAAELQSCFRTVGGELLSDDDAEKAVRISDADGDGMFGFDDFAKLMERTRQDDDDKIRELREAFGMYSVSSPATAGGESYITPKSLKKMLSRLGLGQGQGQSTTISNCKAMIRHFDLNGDGILNFDEFRIMMS